jgi:hypothetical protein
MHGALATYRDGQVIFDAPVDWPDGTRIEVQPAMNTPAELSDDEFDGLLNRLADEFEASTDPSSPPLSDFAVSRQGLYEGHL